MPFQDWHSPADEARFLRTVLDHVSDCLVAIDTQGRIVLINKPYCRLLGGEEGDFLGQDITEVVSPKTRLHLVARGEPAQIGFPLKVRGQQLITKQVPVFQEQEIVGALGFALFSDFDALRSTFTKLSQGRLAFSKSGGSWVLPHDRSPAREDQDRGRQSPASTDPWRNRHRQRACGAGDPSALGSQRRTLRLDQLRIHPGGTD
jgi:hypothetical protein